jgi:hypothetical protein
MNIKTITVCLVLAVATTPAYAGGYREARAWNFEDPITKSLRLAKMQTQEMHDQGGFGPGKSYYSSQTAINIQNQNNIGIENSDNIVIEIDQVGEDQTAGNYLNVGE